jgi:hypothetical protein
LTFSQKDGYFALPFVSSLCYRLLGTSSRSGCVKNGLFSTFYGGYAVSIVDVFE